MKRPIKFRSRDACDKLRFDDLWQRNDGTLIFDWEVSLWFRVYPDSVAQLVGYDNDRPI